MTTQPPTTGAVTTQPTSVPSERCGGPGWRKVAFIDMTNTSQNCPQGLTLTGYSKRSCGRTHTNPYSCSSVTFPVGGGQYSRVCGRAKASGQYQGISGNTVHTAHRCPCNPGNTYGSPPFVGNDYFCESGASSRFVINYRLFPDDPFWDGQGCFHGNPCCSLNNPPWFNQTLLTPTTDDIEMRLCINNGAIASNIALEQMELYVY
ncbi:uncharacterized protein LOC135336313 [Halichondria panicea]|uniref:uncharacterized protein LOC135336313 n=1 Tax=Halichondria panicea TaxID=6063 RepID=UPI00312B6A78